MRHFKKLEAELAKHGSEAQLEDPRFLRKVLLMFSNRLDLLEAWISENTDQDGEKLFFSFFATAEGFTKPLKDMDKEDLESQIEALIIQAVGHFQFPAFLVIGKEKAARLSRAFWPKEVVREDGDTLLPRRITAYNSNNCVNSLKVIEVEADILEVVEDPFKG